jgi:peptidyl-dipeptidase Dcp
VLLSFDDVTGMFHEFGHAMHGMLSDVKYQSLSGTRTPRDFVEYPSQYNEMWAREPAVLAHYARHYKTGEPMPVELLHKILSAQNFNQGYAYSERLAAAVIDLALHEVTAAQAPAAKDLPAFEQAALRKAGLALRTVPPRYHALSAISSAMSTRRATTPTPGARCWPATPAIGCIGTAA